MVQQGQAIAGSPDTVTEFLARQFEDNPANYLVGQFCFGDLSLAEMLRSTELFASHVMPALRNARRQAGKQAAE